MAATTHSITLIYTCLLYTILLSITHVEKFLYYFYDDNRCLHTYRLCVCVRVCVGSSLYVCMYVPTSLRTYYSIHFGKNEKLVKFG